MEFYENLKSAYSMATCSCDEDCGSDSWGCDDDNEGWHSGE